MKKILTIGLAVLAVLLVGMTIGSGQAYAFSWGFPGPSVAADIGTYRGVAYDEAIALNHSSDVYAMREDMAKGLSITPDLESPFTSIAFDKALYNCPTYAEESEELFSGPVLSAEANGIVKGTEDGLILIAMLCE